jgi:signal-transduction protein with cAMP-binding, CBS, and nucleotidyltransferase domain
VLGMLNETLRKQVIAYLNGKMIMDCPLFDDFSGEFISEIIFMLKRKTFSIDDHIFDEYNEGTKMYFMTKGTVILWHSKSHTFIKEIHEGAVFGEGAFFSTNKRI